MSCDLSVTWPTLQPIFHPFRRLFTSQLILQPFRSFTYVTAHSPTLLSIHLRHRLFTYVTWRAAHGTMFNALVILLPDWHWNFSLTLLLNIFVSRLFAGPTLGTTEVHPFLIYSLCIMTNFRWYVDGNPICRLVILLYSDHCYLQSINVYIYTQSEYKVFPCL